MGIFGKKEAKENKPTLKGEVQQGVDTNLIHRQINLKEEVNDSTKILEQLEHQIKIKEETKHERMNFISMAEKEISELKRDLERLESKRSKVVTKKHEAEQELELYNKGIHKAQITAEDLNSMNLNQVLEFMKNHGDAESIYLEKLKTKDSEITKLKKENEQLKKSSKSAPEFGAKISKNVIKESEERKPSLLEKVFGKNKDEKTNEKEEPVVKEEPVQEEKKTIPTKKSSPQKKEIKPKSKSKPKKSKAPKKAKKKVVKAQKSKKK